MIFNKTHTIGIIIYDIYNDSREMEIIKWLTTLSPRALNIALFCLGIFGVIIAYNRGETRITELEKEIRVIQREAKVEKDSLYKVAQVNEALCNQRVLDGQRELISRLDILNQDLNEQLGRKTNADQQRMQQATVNRKAAVRNTIKLRKINETFEIQKQDASSGN